MGSTKRRSSHAARAGAGESADSADVGVGVLDRASKSSVDLVTEFSAGGLTAQHVRVATREGFICDWQGRSHYIALHDLHTKDCEIVTDDEPVSRQRDLRGRLAFVPAGCRSGGWLVPTLRPQSFTALFLDPTRLEDELAGRLRRLPQRARLYFFDPSLTSTLGKLRDCLTDDTAPDVMYAESLCTLAAIELCQISAVVEGETGELSGRTAERVIEYMDQNLSRDISLEDLANVANLSRFHFLRAFRRTTGETPYQHLLRRRIERAQQLLSGQISIAAIAVTVGFKNATRFTAAFRRLTHCTPSVYRAALRR